MWFRSKSQKSFWGNLTESYNLCGRTKTQGTLEIKNGGGTWGIAPHKRALAEGSAGRPWPKRWMNKTYTDTQIFGFASPAECPTAYTPREVCHCGCLWAACTSDIYLVYN